MDGPRFDRLTKLFTASRSRRTLPPLLAALGLAVGARPAVPIKAKRKKRKKKCKSGTTKCGNACVNLQNNPAHCGGCNRPCAAGTSCVNGSCQGTGGCQSPNTLCGSSCVDTRTDRNNCGTCGNTCTSGQNCVNSSCVSACNPPCAAGRDCYQGTCTCSSPSQCANERNPNGFDCIGAPGNPLVTICGCTPFTGQNRRVCVAGEPCSVCCSDLECRTAVPDLPDIICATVPVNGLVGRSCCVPQGGLCGGNNQCCGGGCVNNQCGCLGGGQNCGQHEQCCSNQCGTQAEPNKCAPVG